MRSEFPLLVEERIVKVNGDIGIRTYQKGRMLGKGGFAHVYEFRCLETEKVSAAKLVPKSTLSKPRTRQKLMSEIKVHRSLNHDGIVQFEHFFEDNANVYILLELCENQTLADLMKRRKRLTEIEAQCLIFQIAEALRYLHSHKIIHRDLKLGNLFLNSKMKLKLGDFGLATKLEFEGEKRRTICGTPNYIAPEVLDGQLGHSYEVDLWGLGVLAYTLVCGRPPFETNDVNTTYERIRQNQYEFPPGLTLSHEIKDFMRRTIITDPKERLTLDELMEHPLFVKPFPPLLPVSSLVVPPTSAYVKKFSTEKNGARTERGGRHRREPSPLHSDRGPRLSDIPESPRMEKRTERKNKFMYSPLQTDSPVWIKEWVDCSHKFGLGYLLSNNSIGVYFNDGTNIISDSHGFKLQYSSGIDVREFVYQEYPPELEKKFKLFRHFAQHLKSKTNSVSTGWILLKKWIRGSHALIFRLSNKLVQVKFNDKTEIVISGSNKQLVYVNKRGESSKFVLNGENYTAAVSKRLSYVKEMLSSIYRNSIN